MSIIGTVLMLVILGLYYIIYKLEIPFIEQYKVEKNKPWPWKTEYYAWRKTILHGIYRSVFNSIFVNFFCLSIYAWAYDWEFPWSFDPETIPDALTMMSQILFFIICEDFIFHFSHRFLHWKPIYKHLHK